MHEESFPADRPAIHAFDACIAHAFAFVGLLLSFCGFAFLVTSSQFQPPLIRFGVIIFCVCAVWSATLAVRSLWHREDDDRAWVVLGVCILELNVPLALCIPVIFGGSSAHPLVTLATDYAVPLWLPALSFIAISASLLARWRMRIRERSGQKFSRRDCIHHGVFWAGIVSIPLILVAPVLLFLYALAPVRSSTPIGAPSSYPTDWRATVLEHSPYILPDTLARITGRKRFGEAGEMNQSLEIYGLVSSAYLLERIETGKNNSSWFAYTGLAQKYPDVALPLARRIWAEPYTDERRLRFQNAAAIFVKLYERPELLQLLSESPPPKDVRRATLLAHLSFSKRSDVNDAIQRIAEDRSAPDRLNAIEALAPFRSIDDLKPLWFDFVRTASAEQYSAAATGVYIPKDYELEICEQALRDTRTVVLRCWLAGFPFRAAPDLAPSNTLLVRLLELSEHPDLSVRRGALRAIASRLDTMTSIPEQWGEDDYYGRWWEKEPTLTETQAELDQTENLRSRARDELKQSGN